MNFRAEWPEGVGELGFGFGFPLSVPNQPELSGRRKLDVMEISNSHDSEDALSATSTHLPSARIITDVRRLHHQGLPENPTSLKGTLYYH